jgi:hypothetical protein
MYYLLNRFCFSRSRPLLLTFAGFGLCPLLLSDSSHVLGCVSVYASSNEDPDYTEQTGAEIDLQPRSIYRERDRRYPGGKHIVPSARQRDILLTAELTRFRSVAC